MVSMCLNLGEKANPLHTFSKVILIIKHLRETLLTLEWTKEQDCKEQTTDESLQRGHHKSHMLYRRHSGKEMKKQKRH